MLTLLNICFRVSFCQACVHTASLQDKGRKDGKYHHMCALGL